jgi:hypothetical protein
MRRMTVRRHTLNRCSALALATLATTALGAGVCAGAASAAARPRGDRWKPTVALVRATVGGVGIGEVGVAEARCPGGYSVLGGSYVIGGESLFAHAAGATPIPGENLYRAIVVNPPVNPFARVGARDATITAAAICAEDGRPVVFDGPIGPPKHAGGDNTDPRPGLLNGNLPSTVDMRVTEATGVQNGDVRKVDSGCSSGALSVFSGGYTIGDSLWGHAANAAVLSQTNDYSATLVTPPSNPSLGVFRANASIRVLAICATNRRPVVFNDGPMSAAAGARAAARARRAPRAPRMRGTVKLVKKQVGGIVSGSVRTVSARCPSGYSVFGGSHLIGGNSVLTHPMAAAVASKTNAYTVTVVNPPTNINAGIPRTTATLLVAATCTRRATPLVVDGPFG